MVKYEIGMKIKIARIFCFLFQKMCRKEVIYESNVQITIRKTSSGEKINWETADGKTDCKTDRLL